jgi:hypothetical protein
MFDMFSGLLLNGFAVLLHCRNGVELDFSEGVLTLVCVFEVL